MIHRITLCVTLVVAGTAFALYLGMPAPPPRETPGIVRERSKYLVDVKRRGLIQRFEKDGPTTATLWTGDNYRHVVPDEQYSVCLFVFLEVFADAKNPDGCWLYVKDAAGTPLARFQPRKAPEQFFDD